MDTGFTDSFTDYAFDAQYQYIMIPHLFTFRGTWIHEDQDWDASFPSGGTSNPSDTLKTLNVNAEYVYRASFGAIGGYLGYFHIDGNTDPLLYPPGPVGGSWTGSPDSTGYILQASYVWREKYKFSVQYTLYDKLNGGGKNYDGSGRDASDNNTIYLLVWLMF